MLQHHHLHNDRTVLVTSSTRKWIPIFRDPACAREAIETLYRVQQLHPFFLHAFVFMPNHCHFLMRVLSPETLAGIMKSFKGGSAHSIGRGPIWNTKFDAQTLRFPAKALAYIHQNPVKAGLVKSAELYPWSSASGKWDVSPLEFE